MCLRSPFIDYQYLKILRGLMLLTVIYAPSQVTIKLLRRRRTIRQRAWILGDQKLEVVEAVGNGFPVDNRGV